MVRVVITETRRDVIVTLQHHDGGEIRKEETMEYPTLQDALAAVGRLVQTSEPKRRKVA